MTNQFIYHPKAIDLIQDEKVIRMKNELIEQLELQLQNIGKQTAEQYPALARISPHPKVSKGEKHQGLPFVVLDFPRIYKQNDFFAIRTLIWWSKHISVSLILKGKYLDNHFSKLKENIKNEKFKALYLSTSGNLWSNELNHKVAESKQLTEDIDFFKLSFKFPLDQLNELESNYYHSIEQLLSIIDYANS